MTDTNTTPDFRDQNWRREVEIAANAISALDRWPVSSMDRETLAMALLYIGSPVQWRHAVTAAAQTIFTTDVPNEDLFWRGLTITTSELRLVLQAYLNEHQGVSDADRRKLAPCLRELGTDAQLLDALRHHDEWWARVSAAQTRTLPAERTASAEVEFEFPDPAGGRPKDQAAAQLDGPKGSSAELTITISSGLICIESGEDWRRSLSAALSDEVDDVCNEIAPADVTWSD